MLVECAVWCLCQLYSKSRKWRLKALSVHGGKGWNCSSTACTSCPKRPGGSDRPRKRKSKKVMWNLKLLNFIFKVTLKKDDEKAPPKQHSVYKMRNRRKITWLAGPYTTDQSFSSALSLLTSYISACGVEEPWIVLTVAQRSFSLGQRERLNRMCSIVREPCFTPLQTSHKTVNKPTGGKRTALCWSS